MDDKVRVDVLLVEQGKFASREKARAAVMAGLVYIGEEKVEKAGTKVDRATALHVRGAEHPYVGRGGMKLEKAIRTFELDLSGVVMLDIGASTGGFTDCALQHGAAVVYAIDVGYNQLAWSLRNDPRVIVMERTNFRYVTKEQLQGPQPSVATIDVSFISLEKILPPLRPLLPIGAHVIALIKPQFEAGKEHVGKAGVVRDPEVHKRVLHRICTFAADSGFRCDGLTFSPIQGGEGNTEFLVCWTLRESPEDDDKLQQERRIEQVVFEAAAHFAR